MQKYLWKYIKPVMLVCISILMVGGCSSNIPAATQPATSQYQADFTVVQSTAKILRGGNQETAVQQNQTVKVGIDDRIELDKQSRSFLNFPGILDAELLRNAIILLSAIKQESGGSTEITLNLNQGHLFLRLNDTSIGRVTVETPYATIKTLEDGTEFDVCHNEALTCVWVKKGTAEVIAEGKKEILNTGEASYILKDQPPSMAICAPIDTFSAWEENFRASANTPALGKVVAGLPQRSCSSTAPDITDLPKADGMAKIIYGTYEIGRSPADEFHSPLQSIPLTNFWIDIHEVTNAQYQQYLDMTASQPPAIWPGEGDHPVRGVTWDQAAAYCSWAKKRLPREAEWEVAGRGPGQTAPLFPWGNNPVADGQIDDLPLDDTYSVGTFPFNVSPFGVYDMVGNVWEWVSEPYDSVQEGYKILRGGRYGFITDLAYRQPTLPNDERFVPYTGFRCAADEVQGE